MRNKRTRSSEKSDGSDKSDSNTKRIRPSTVAALQRAFDCVQAILSNLSHETRFLKRLDDDIHKPEWVHLRSIFSSQSVEKIDWLPAIRSAIRSLSDGDRVGVNPLDEKYLKEAEEVDFEFHFARETDPTPPPSEDLRAVEWRDDMPWPLGYDFALWSEEKRYNHFRYLVCCMAKASCAVLPAVKHTVNYKGTVHADLLTSLREMQDAICDRYDALRLFLFRYRAPAYTPVTDRHPSDDSTKIFPALTWYRAMEIIKRSCGKDCNVMGTVQHISAYAAHEDRDALWDAALTSRLRGPYWTHVSFLNSRPRSRTRFAVLLLLIRCEFGVPLDIVRDRLLFITGGKRYAGPSDFHTNVLFIDHLRKSVERYEPHGWSLRIINHVIDATLPKHFKLFGLAGYDYFPPSQTCLQYGLQYIENGPTCEYWCVLIAYLRVKDPNRYFKFRHVEDVVIAFLRDRPDLGFTMKQRLRALIDKWIRIVDKYGKIKLRIQDISRSLRRHTSSVEAAQALARTYYY